MSPQPNLQTFLSTLSPMEAGKARKALSRSWRLGDLGLHPLHEHVERALAQGGKVGSVDTGAYIRTKIGGFPVAFDKLPQVAFKYAEHIRADVEASRSLASKGRDPHFDAYITAAGEDPENVTRLDVYDILAQAPDPDQLDRLSWYLAENWPSLEVAIREAKDSLIEERGWGGKPKSAPKSPPKPASKPKSPRKSPKLVFGHVGGATRSPAGRTEGRVSAQSDDMADFATLMEASLKSIFPKMFTDAKLVKPAPKEPVLPYVLGSFYRSPRTGGRAMADQARRFMIVVLADKKVSDWKQGVVAKIQENDVQGFLMKEGIKYPARFTGKPMEVLVQINDWLNTNAKSLVGGTPPKSPPKPASKSSGDPDAIQWTPALQRAADALIVISCETQDDESKVDEKTWERYRGNAYMAALRQELVPNVRYDDDRSKNDLIRAALKKANVPWENGIPILIEARLKQLGGKPPKSAPKPSSKPKSAPKSAPKPKPSSRPPTAGPSDKDMARFADKLDKELRELFPKLYVGASLLNPGSPEHFVQASFARSPRRDGKKAAKTAPRFFVVIQPDRAGKGSRDPFELDAWVKRGATARIREHHKHGFLAAESIRYPDEIKGKPSDVLSEVLGWFKANSAALVGAVAAPASPLRKTNAQLVYEALGMLGPKATTKEITSKLAVKLPASVVEKNLAKLQQQGMVFSYGPSGGLSTQHQHTYGPSLALPFWATREQVIERGMASQDSLPPVQARWAAPIPTASPAISSEPVVTAPTPTSTELHIDSASALIVLAEIEGPEWLAAQEADRAQMGNPNGFYSNLAAYQILQNMGARAAGLTLSDIVPGAGMIVADAGRIYAVLPDGQIALYSETTTPAIATQAAMNMLVV